MGISITGVYSKWEKNKKTVFIPKECGFYPEPEGGFPDGYLELVFNTFIYSMMDDEFSELFKEKDEIEAWFERYKGRSAKFIEGVRAFKDSDLKRWVLSHKGKFIAYNYNGFWAADAIAAVEREMWEGKDPIHLGVDDDRAAFDAVINLESMYGVTIEKCIISQDHLNNISAENASYLENEYFNFDVARMARETEEALKGIVKKDGDEFFEPRMKRIEKILEAAKQGGRIVVAI